jgi:polyisoprenoid-binding protein YceI
MRLSIVCLLAAAVLPSLGRAQVPVFQITLGDSSIKFDVEASVSIVGTFDKWNATFTVTSPDVRTGVLDVKIQADSVDTGSGMKNGKLKSKDFFDVKSNPYITFKSTKIIPTGPNSADVQGIFTIRGVSNPETLKLSGERSTEHPGGIIQGTMAFDRKDYGMTSGIPFIKIADHVEVTILFHAKRLSGPPLVVQAQ